MSGKQLVPDEVVEDLVPDDFDLEEAHKQTTTTPDEKRKRCPECKAFTIERRVNKNGFNGGYVADDGATYRCTICGATFDNPEVKKRC